MQGKKTQKYARNENCKERKMQGIKLHGTENAKMRLAITLSHL